MGLRITKNNFALSLLLLLLLLSLLLLLLFANAMFMIRSDLFFLLNPTITSQHFFPGGRFCFPGLAGFYKLPQDHYGIKNLIFNF